MPRYYRRLIGNPNINRTRRLRRTLTRTDSSQDYLETIIIHSDSSDEERRLDNEIDELRNRMDELDEEKIRLRREMAKKYKERETIRVARYVKKNNLRLKNELESRLLPTIEGIAARRRDVLHGIRDLFENIDDNEHQLPPTYESLFPPTPQVTNVNATATTSTSNNNTNTNDGNTSDASTSSTCSLPSASSLLNSIINN